MNTNKLFLLLAASALTGAFVAATALAEPARPVDPYQRLSAVDMNPGQAPQLAGGFSSLSGDERRFKEPLPVQLSGPVHKVNAKASKRTEKKAKKSKKAKGAKNAKHHQPAKQLPGKTFKS